jgi:hypothetical protein
MTCHKHLNPNDDTFPEHLSILKIWAGSYSGYMQKIRCYLLLDLKSTESKIILNKSSVILTCGILNNAVIGLDWTTLKGKMISE